MALATHDLATQEGLFFALGRVGNQCSLKTSKKTCCGKVWWEGTMLSDPRCKLCSGVPQAAPDALGVAGFLCVMCGRNWFTKDETYTLGDVVVCDCGARALARTVGAKRHAKMFVAAVSRSIRAQGMTVYITERQRERALLLKN
jgi:hypothetical protein